MVSLEIVLVDGAVSTPRELAWVWLIAVVSLHMSLHIGRARQSLLTAGEFTSERLFAAMGPLVNLELFVFCDSLLTTGEVTGELCVRRCVYACAPSDCVPA